VQRTDSAPHYTAHTSVIVLCRACGLSRQEDGTHQRLRECRRHGPAIAHRRAQETSHDGFPRGAFPAKM